MREPTRPDLPFMTGQISKEYSSELHTLYGLLSSAYDEVGTFRSCIGLADLGFHQTKKLREARSVASMETNAALKTSLSMVENWPKLAAHSAISTLFQFQKVLSRISDWARNSVVRSALVNPAAADDGAKLFEKHFPKWKQTRHATAHNAEIRLNPEKNWHTGALSNAMIAKPKGARLLMTDCFENRTFITTRKGEVLRFDVS